MKIAAYCRVSTEKEAQIDSLEKQIEFFNDFTKKNGYELYKLYADEGISGKQIKHRKQFQQMMQDAKAKKFERVVVKEEDIGTDKLVKYCSLSSSNSEGELIIGCGIEFSTKLFHYQLLTCEVSVTYNEQTSNISIYLSRADHNSDRTYLNGGTATGIPMTGNAKATVSLIEIVLYRFD